MSRKRLQLRSFAKWSTLALLVMIGASAIYSMGREVRSAGPFGGGMTTLENGAIRFFVGDFRVPQRTAVHSVRTFFVDLGWPRMTHAPGVRGLVIPLWTPSLIVALAAAYGWWPDRHRLLMLLTPRWLALHGCMLIVAAWACAVTCQAARAHHVQHHQPDAMPRRLSEGWCIHAFGWHDLVRSGAFQRPCRAGDWRTYDLAVWVPLGVLATVTVALWTRNIDRWRTRRHPRRRAMIAIGVFILVPTAWAASMWCNLVLFAPSSVDWSLCLRMGEIDLGGPLPPWTHWVKSASDIDFPGEESWLFSLHRESFEAFGSCSLWPTFYFQYGHPTLIVPLWLPSLISLLGIWCTVATWRRHARRPPPDHCSRCGYNLTGNTSGICPECGVPTSAA